MDVTAILATLRVSFWTPTFVSVNFAVGSVGLVVQIHVQEVSVSLRVK